LTHVFSLEAMATCEQRGHAFAWVRTWHDVGFDECTRCGLTRPGGAEESAAGILPGTTVDEPQDHVADVGQVVTPKRGPGAPAKTERNEKIRARVAAGESRSALAQEFGVSLCLIYQIAPISKGSA